VASGLQEGAAALLYGVKRKNLGGMKPFRLQGVTDFCMAIGEKQIPVIVSFSSCFLQDIFHLNSGTAPASLLIALGNRSLVRCWSHEPTPFIHC